MWPFLAARKTRKVRILNRVSHFVTPNRIGVLISKMKGERILGRQFCGGESLGAVCSFSVGLSLCVFTSSTPLSPAAPLPFAENNTKNALTRLLCAVHSRRGLRDMKGSEILLVHITQCWHHMFLILPFCLFHTACLSAVPFLFLLPLHFIIRTPHLLGSPILFLLVSRAI